MKYIFAILLSVSLYSPDITRLVAYADYIVDFVSKDEVNICDCEDILQKNESPGHREHHIILKTQLTYIITEVFLLQDIAVSNDSEFTDPVNILLPRASYDIFQPPRV